jgi:hypothetical protein
MTTPTLHSYFSPKRKKMLPVAITPIHHVLNKEVERELQVSSTPPSSSRKRKRYNGEYSGELRAKIARYAIEHGNTAAARKFSNELENDIHSFILYYFKLYSFISIQQ